MKQDRMFQNLVRYCRLRDVQFHIYDTYARRQGIPVKSLFVLNAIYYSPQGCTQMEICQKAFSSKQTVNAIIKGYLKQGMVQLTEQPEDRRTKIVQLTKKGREYAKNLIEPVTVAEMLAIKTLTMEEQETLLQLSERFGNCLNKELLQEETKWNSMK